MDIDFSLIVDGIKIVGKCLLPREWKNKNFPVICLCHGIPGGKIVEDKARGTGQGEGPPSTIPEKINNRDAPPGGYEGLARFFQEKGMAGVFFNFRGTGESGGNFDLAGWTRDLAAVTAYLERLPETRDKDLTLAGFSGGAAVAAYHTARNPKVHSLVLAACPAGFHFMISETTLGDTLKKLREIGIIREEDFPHDPRGWLKEALSIRPREEVGRVSPRPLLLLHGTGDRLVPVGHAHQLYRAAREPKVLKLLEGGPHQLRKDRRALEELLRWRKALPGN